MREEHKKNNRTNLYILLMTSETDFAPWCYKWDGLGFCRDWKSLGGAMLRAPTEQIACSMILRNHFWATQETCDL